MHHYGWCNKRCSRTYF